MRGKSGEKWALESFTTRGEQARGGGEVDIRYEQSFFTVWLVAEQRPVGAHHRRT